MKVTEGTNMNEWEEIYMFPGYSVSPSGFVRNDDTGRLLARTINQRGIVTVGLMRNRHHHCRAVINLVANAYLPRPHNREADFDTPINRDGDRSNVHVDNLMWRPNWFAIKYFRQFRVGHVGIMRPIEDISTHRVYENSWEAAVTHGLLDREILVATIAHTYVFPTFQRFRVIT